MQTTLQKLEQAVESSTGLSAKHIREISPEELRNEVELRQGYPMTIVGARKVNVPYAG